jgi:hypothetical protein
MLVSGSEVSGNAETTSHLCERCSAINFNSLFRKRLTRAKGLQVLRLGKICDFAHPSSCRLCLYFAKLVLESHDTSNFGENTEYHLYAFSAVRAFLIGFSPVQNTLNGLRGGICLAVLPEQVSGVPQELTQFIGLVQTPDHDGLQIKALNPATVDMQSIRQWYSFCSEHHIYQCALEPTTRVPGLQVIDCIRRKIVKWRGEKYSALSYVWGNSDGVHHGGVGGSMLPPSVPAVIEDAMTLSCQLDLPFIWVDKYCIPQDNVQEKQKQIKHMDLVYKFAELTIIAAAGSDPHYGLPGVGYRSRPPQQKLKLHDMTLLASLPNPTSEIKRSRWMRRGWTFQEALLSRRRLIFTERQVYFECRTMHCCEAIGMPLDAIHRKNRQQCKNGILPGLFPHKIIGDSRWEFMHLVNEYSQRELSHESDRLNALLGIFHALSEQDKLPKYHYLGVPLMKVCHLTNSAIDSLEAFLVGLK